MSYTNFPTGITAFGVPLMNGPQIPSTTGNYYFVSSVSGSDGNIGTEVQKPKATLASALLLAFQTSGANHGDVIVLMPGHVESVNAAAYLTIANAGYYIVGIGQGASRPTLTWKTSTAAQIIVSAANITFDNIVFDFTGIDAVVAAISVTGTDVSFVNSTFITNSATTGVVKGILTAATATRLRVENCLFYGPAVNSGTTTTAQIGHEVGTDYVIRGNYFTGKMTQSILNATTLLRGLIDNNRFVIATGTVAITMASASTPFITNNRINVPSGTTPITAAAGFVAGNVYSAAAGVTAGTASTI